MMHSENPLVSVSMPVFNSGRYLAEAIQSILDQTYANFELLILDDGSTDGTRDIIRSFSDSRIIPIFNDANKGLISARNEIAQKATGKYIALMDADDKAFPERLELQVKFLEAGEADICGSSHLSFFQDTGKVKRSKECYSDSDIRALLTVYCPLSNPCIMAKAEVFHKLPYQASNRHAEDYCLWIDAAKAGFRFGNLKKELLLYRVHPGQISLLKKIEAENVARVARENYLEFLGIEKELLPRPLGFLVRRIHAIRFMFLINRKIAGVSFRANSEIYSRFQWRRNFLEKLASRVERFVVALFATVVGRL